MSNALERVVKGFCWAAAAVLLLVFLTIVLYLFYKGGRAVNLRLVFGETPVLEALMLSRPVFGGLFAAIAGTIMLVFLAVGLALPVGIAAGIYMAEYAAGFLKNALGLFFDVLAGVPSIVVGLFGFSVAIFLHRTVFPELFPSLLISAIALAVLVLPYIIRSTQYALEGVPGKTRIIAPALGATRLQNILQVLLPQASFGIVSGAILAIGRCAEDTAVIMLTGVVAFAGIPRTLTANYEALPFYIYYITSQYADQKELATGYGAALILLGICALFFLISLLIQRGFAYRALYRP